MMYEFCYLKEKYYFCFVKTRSLMNTDNNIKDVEKVFQYWLSSSDKNIRSWIKEKL
jgi:hypothetical protein